MKIGEKKNLIREKMERNVIKILSKKRCKRCVTLPLNSLQRGITLPFLIFTDDALLWGTQNFFFVTRSL